MDNPSTPNDSGNSLSLPQLAAQHIALRNLVNIMLLALVILTSSLTAFIWREFRVVSRQVQEHSRLVSDYRQNIVPKLDDLHTKMRVFTTANPDFAPIFAKYFGSSNAPPSSVPPTTPPSSPAR